MKKLLLASALLFISFPAFAQDTYVNGYYRSNGTYVQPHYRSAPNNTTSDNWSTRGNVNPHTGAIGTRSPDTGYGSIYSPRPNSSYGSGNILGSRPNYGGSVLGE